MKNKYVSSPLFYVGGKEKLMSQIACYLPTDIERLIEPFVGGGSVFMNVEAREYLLNDLNKSIIKIHLMLNSYCGREEEFFEKIFSLIRHYDLSFDCNGMSSGLDKGCRSSIEIKNYNSAGYYRMRKDFNDGGMQDTMMLYLLLIYGFNRMTRFNKKGKFNLPVGNLDFNDNTFMALNDYFCQSEIKHPQWHNQDFMTFLNGIDYEKNDLVYLDPPYLITSCEYNKMWNEEYERNLIACMDHLDKRGVRFAVSNVIIYRDRRNEIFGKWASQYNIHQIHSNYKNYHDNSKKKIHEVLVTNY